VTGQRAYKTIRNESDDAGADWLDEHMDRAEKTIGAFYFLAALGVVGLLVPIKWPKAAFPLAEFRPSETPTPPSETDHADK
jgi:hypothetical protein